MWRAVIQSNPHANSHRDTVASADQDANSHAKCDPYAAAHAPAAPGDG